MTHNSRNVVIAGGGVAGLTCALFLAKAGFRVEVFEQAGGIEPIGAGLQLSPNALFVLNELGLLNQIKTVSTAPDSIWLITAKNARVLAQVPLGITALERYGMPYLLIHRADLCQILAKACHDHTDIQLHLGSKVIDAVPHLNGITAMVFSNNKITEYVGRAVIAADGVWSKFRTDYLEAKPATYSGFAAWRALIPSEKVTRAQVENTQVWLHGSSHAVTYPVRNGRYLNVVITKPEREAERDVLAGTGSGELIEVTSDWDTQFTALLNHRARWTRWPIYHSSLPKQLGVDRMVAIGDAAHAMVPHAAQGAALAIEDAMVISDCLKSNEDTDLAFASFEKLRRSRLTKAGKLAETNQWIYQMGRPMSAFRDLALKIAPSKRLLARQDWLYGWQGR